MALWVPGCPGQPELRRREIGYRGGVRLPPANPVQLLGACGTHTIRNVHSRWSIDHGLLNGPTRSSYCLWSTPLVHSAWDGTGRPVPRPAANLRPVAPGPTSTLAAVCGRTTSTMSRDTLAELLNVDEVDAPELPISWNVAPTQPVYTVAVSSTGARRLTALRWGLVPNWAKDPRIGAKLINARSETLEHAAGIPFAHPDAPRPGARIRLLRMAAPRAWARSLSSNLFTFTAFEAGRSCSPVSGTFGSTPRASRSAAAR